MKTLSRTAALLTALCSNLLVGGFAVAATAQTTLYHNGPILTMAGEVPVFAEALLEQDGRIVFVGSLAEAKKRSTKEEFGEILDLFILALT